MSTINVIVIAAITIAAYELTGYVLRRWPFIRSPYDHSTARWEVSETDDQDVSPIEIRRTEDGRRDQWIKIKTRAELFMAEDAIRAYLKSSRHSHARNR